MELIKSSKKAATFHMCLLPHSFFLSNQQENWKEDKSSSSKHFWHANLVFWSPPAALEKRTPQTNERAMGTFTCIAPSPQTPSGFRLLALGWFGLTWRIETWEPFVSTPFWVKCYIFHLKSPFKKKNMVWKKDTIWKPSPLMESLLNVTLCPSSSVLN